MAVDDIYRTTLAQEVNGIQLVNVFYYKEASSPSGANAEEDINQYVEDEVLPVLVASLSTSWEALCVQTVRVAPGAQVPFQKVFSASNVGTVSGTALPANCVMAISEYSDDFTKAGRGRFFQSGWNTDDEDDNCFTSAAFTRGQNIAAEWRSRIDSIPSTGEYDRVIYGGDPPTDKLLYKTEVRSQVRKLRSRTRRRCV